MKICCCYNHPLNLWSTIGIILKYRVHFRLFNKKMKVLTYTSYKEHCDLYTEIHGSIAVNNCQVRLAEEDVILLSKIFMIVYKAGKRTGVENIKFISFNLLAGTYSIHDFNAKLKVAILQKRQDWEPSQIKDLRLVIPKD